MISPVAVVFGLLVASPTLWAAFVEGSLSADVAMQRMLVILVVTVLGWAAVQRLVAGFVLHARRVAVEQQRELEAIAVQAERRSTD